MKITFDSQTIEINPADDGYVAIMNGGSLAVQVLRVDATRGRMDLLLDERRASAHVSSDGAKRWVTVNGQTCVLTKTSGAKRGVRHEHAGGLTAPMPGQVRSVAVGVGEAVKKGQTLLTMEAMKMEIRIQALKEGIVSNLLVRVGQTVEREEILIEIVDRLEG